MSDATKASAPRATVKGWLHFGVAAAVLAVTAIGFEYAIATLKWVTQKEPVPWPKDVVVSPDHFRWENLPAQVGSRYEVAADGELYRNKPADGVPDGENIIREELMETLKIGTPLDKARVGERRSNWYTSRVYRDNRLPDGHPLKYWQLDVYYYTGGLDTVPHVPERCMQAAGATPLGTEEVVFSVPAARSPWDGDVRFQRARFSVPDPDGFGSRDVSEYYVFSLNGKPETSWERVRLELTYPWLRYTYFAKIQFGPVGGGIDVESTDAAAEDFMNYFLPVIAQALPRPEDVAALEAAQEQAE